MQNIQTIVNRKQIPWLRAVTVAAGLCLFAVLSPFIWLALTGSIGLLALAAVLATGFTFVQALPLLGQKLENQLLARRKAEARRNPIEQLQNEVVRRAQRLQDFRRALVTVGGQIESIREMLEMTHHKSPGFAMDRQVRALERLQQFHTLNMDRLSKAHSALQDFKETVNNKGRQWEISIAIGEATEALDPNGSENLMQDLLTDTALRTVQDRFNAVFSELDVQMGSVDGPTRQLLSAQNQGLMEALRLPETQPERITR